MTRAPFREVISLGEKKNTDKWFDNFLIAILEETNNMICDLEKKHLTCTIKNNKILRVITCRALSMELKKEDIARESRLILLKYIIYQIGDLHIYESI